MQRPSTISLPVPDSAGLIALAGVSLGAILVVVGAFLPYYEYGDKSIAGTEAGGVRNIVEMVGAVACLVGSTFGSPRNRWLLVGGLVLSLSVLANTAQLLTFDDVDFGAGIWVTFAGAGVSTVAIAVGLFLVPSVQQGTPAEQGSDLPG